MLPLARTVPREQPLDNHSIEGAALFEVAANMSSILQARSICNPCGDSVNRSRTVGGNVVTAVGDWGRPSQRADSGVLAKPSSSGNERDEPGYDPDTVTTPSVTVTLSATPDSSSTSTNGAMGTPPAEAPASIVSVAVKIAPFKI